MPSHVHSYQVIFQFLSSLWRQVITLMEYSSHLQHVFLRIFAHFPRLFPNHSLPKYLPAFPDSSDLQGQRESLWTLGYHSTLFTPQLVHLHLITVISEIITYLLAQNNYWILTDARKRSLKKLKKKSPIWRKEHECG